MTDFENKIKPTEIRLKREEKILEIDFSDGKSFSLPAEYLRVESPSAEVQGHGPGQKKIISGRQHVGIMSIDPIGNYAIRINFDDLHDTGIFTWELLYQYGEEKTERWKAYQTALLEKGLSRDPRDESTSPSTH